MTRLTIPTPSIYKTTIGFDSMFDEMANAFQQTPRLFTQYCKGKDSSYN